MTRIYKILPRAAWAEAQAACRAALSLTAERASGKDAAASTAQLRALEERCVAALAAGRISSSRARVHTVDETTIGPCLTDIAASARR